MDFSINTEHRLSVAEINQVAGGGIRLDLYDDAIMPAIPPIKPPGSITPSEIAYQHAGLLAGRR